MRKRIEENGKGMARCRPLFVCPGIGLYCFFAGGFFMAGLGEALAVYLRL
jgi:hypothetical protein